MKNFKIFAFVLVFVSYMTNSYSQGTTSIHFGAAIPVSDFGSSDMDEEDAGGASFGLNLGFQYIYPITETGLGIFGGIDLNYNGLSKKYKDGIKESFESLGISNPDIDYYKYINIPITAGLNYTYQADDKIGVFANAGLAFNFLKITEMEMTYRGQTITTEMDLANHLGLKIGGGILINKLCISLDYFALGKHDINGKVKTTGYSEKIDGEVSVDILTLTLGIRF